MKNVKENIKKSLTKKNLILVGIIIVILLAIGYGTKKPDLKGYFSKIFSQQKKITIDEAKTKAHDFITNNLVAPGTKFDITNVSEEYNLYKFDIDVTGQKISAYMTEDGKTFFPSALNIAETEQKTADAKKQQKEASKPAPKSDKPVVDLYIMAFCPYGNKAEDTIKPVYELLKNKVDFNFHYIVNSNGDAIQSLHGDKEVTQDEREACVLKNYGKDKWIEFATYVNTNCGSDGICWEAGAKSLGINSDKVTTCVETDGLALMKENEKASNDAGATGSPTMVINGSQSQAVYQYGNSEAYKKVICDAFNQPPKECSKTLSSGSSASSSASTSADPGASCN